MATQNEQLDLHVGKFEPSQRLKTLSYSFIGLGVLAFAIGLMRDPQRLWTSYLTSFFFFACLGLGGLFFVAINHIAKAGWSVTIRRYAEGMTAFIPVMLVASLVLVFGVKHVYTWSDPEVTASNALVAAKTAYLNIPFLIARLLVFGIGMLIFRKLLVGASLAQDKSGDASLTLKSVGRSIAFVLFFALSFSLFSVDLLMSLLPTWYSTIFGVYCFAGLFQSSLAFLALIIIYMKRKGFVRGYVTTEHLHDVVKYLKAFTVFWAYIAFSQFLLIWYANIPEETEYYIMRAQHGWLGISMALLVFRFIVPFLALLPRGAKRNENHVILISILVLVMQYVDIYWMVYPNFNGGGVTFGFLEVSLFLGFLGLFLSALMGFFQRNSLVALRDPRLDEALNHHVTY
jgi:hypothetical protein